MRPILPGMDTLAQHLEQLQQTPESYRPEFCPHCGKQGLWVHGTYSRKCDREGRGEVCLNPVPIPRFYCHDCLHTCSVLPECIAPRRWYPWSVQQLAIVLYLAGTSFRKIAERMLPCLRIQCGVGGRVTAQTLPSTPFICAISEAFGAFTKP